MSISHLSFILCFSLLTQLSYSSSLYTSPHVFFPNYQKMLQTFKIFIYTPPDQITFSSPVETHFFTSLKNSPYFTLNPEEAHLFFIPFSSNTSTRSLVRLIKYIRSDFSYWNRTLGADHFYVSCSGLGYESDRNLVELKKNSIQISCFPLLNGNFVPHKDITLPPLVDNETMSFKSKGKVGKGEYCLFEYGAEDNYLISNALRLGCLPVVITDRPIQDLPLMDLLRWQEIVVIVGLKNVTGGVNRVKSVLDRTCGSGGTCDEMRKLGVEGSKHLVWNQVAQPYDAFNMVMYQLWIRRHVIRYARRDWI